MPTELEMKSEKRPSLKTWTNFQFAAVDNHPIPKFGLYIFVSIRNLGEATTSLTFQNPNF